MKASQAMKVIGGALIVVASLNAYAQSSDAMAASGAMAAPSAKSTKAANRALQRTVRARNGAVTLEGSVPEQGQSDIATQAAQGVAGVTSVKNDLTIRAIGQ
jgi:hyperosmotically inducible protein